MVKNVKVDVLVPAEVVDGVEANCYRILPDPEESGKYLLDWLFKEPDADCAMVVSRVRIPSGLLRTFEAEAARTGSSDVSGLKIRFSEVAG